VTGLKPRELAEALRIKRFKAMLRAGKSMPMPVRNWVWIIQPRL